MAELQELLSILEIELKRGTLTLCVLSQLKEPQYGYSLLQILLDKQVEIEAGTLYPLLRRLEKQEILISSWDTTETRPRKFYSLSEKGMEVFNYLKNDWNVLAKQMSNLLGGKENEYD